MTESEIVTECLSYLKGTGVLHWRNNNVPIKGRAFRGLLGVPDVIVVLNDGRFCGLEMKKPGAMLSEDQKKFRDNCEKRNAVYLVINSKEELIEKLRGYL